jgi:large conductance mechanosensitive channel
VIEYKKRVDDQGEYMAAKKNITKNAGKMSATERAKKAEERARRIEARLDRLKEVRPQAVTKHARGFVDFLREQSVVGLAIGLVLGTQVKQVVDQIVNSFINPLLGLLLPGSGTLAQKTFTVHLGEKTGVFGWGAVANILLSFIIVAALVYWAFKALKLDKLTKKKDEPKPEEKEKAGKKPTKGKAKK